MAAAALCAAQPYLPSGLSSVLRFVCETRTWCGVWSTLLRYLFYYGSTHSRLCRKGTSRGAWVPVDPKIGYGVSTIVHGN